MVKGIGEPKKIEKENHFDGLKFSFVESVMVFNHEYPGVDECVCLWQ